MGRIAVGLSGVFFGALLVTVWWLGSGLDTPIAPPTARAVQHECRARANDAAVPTKASFAVESGAVESGAVESGAADRSARDTGVGQRTVVADPAFSRYVIRGVVTRAGVGQAGREVVCVGGDVPFLQRAVTQDANVQKVITDRDGAFAFDVLPGRYRVRALHAIGTVHRQPAFRRLPAREVEPLAAACATCDVEAEDVTLEMPLSPNAIVVTVRDAVTLQPVPSARVSWRPPAPAREELRFVADAHGSVRIADVVAGSNGLRASARAFQPADLAVEVAARGPDRVVDLLLQPTGAIDVVMVDGQQQPVSVSPAQVLALHPIDREGPRPRDPVFPSNRKQFLSKQRPMQTPFDQIEPGAYELHFDEDRYGMLGEDLTVRFVPCVPLRKHVLEVQPGKVRRFEVPVASRCLARFRFVDEQGTLLKGEMRLRFRGADEVERSVLPAPWHHGTNAAGVHFEGYLKQGTYEMRFQRGDRTFRQSFVVETLAIDRTVRLPW